MGYQSICADTMTNLSSQSLKSYARKLLQLRSIFVALIFCYPQALGAATYIVTNNGDAGGVSLCDGITPCSLRQAITAANTSIGLDTIAFFIPAPGVQTITPATSLPSIIDPVIINGYTQPASAPATGVTPATILIEISGAAAPNSTNGLTLSNNSSGSFILGLAINRFKNPAANTGNGILIITSGNHFILGNYLGTDASGTIDLGNLNNGIQDTGNLGNNNIGDGTPAGRNIISGNNNHGIVSLTNNNIKGNYIGTNALGNAALGNTTSGINLAGANNKVGCGLYPAVCNAAEGNVISANGIGIGISAAPNYIKGNLVGTDFLGNNDLGNLGSGIVTGGGGPLTIGCEQFPAVCSAQEGNVISGNGGNGISNFGRLIAKANKIGTNSSGTAAIPNNVDGIQVLSANNIIGCELAPTPCLAQEGNLISGNSRIGIYLASGGIGTNIIRKNFIGTDIAGNAAIGNISRGIYVISTANQIIENLVSGNGSDGILLSTSNFVKGNLIGTNASGTAAIPNASRGIIVVGSNNVIGCDLFSCSALETNLISGNLAAGIFFDINASTNILRGNFIGTDINGTTAIGNRNQGIDILGTDNDIVENLISGNGVSPAGALDGVRVRGVLNSLKGNKIGTNALGTAALPNLENGIRVTAINNVIGCDAAPASCSSSEGNLISGNIQNGILVTSNTNTIKANLIGTNFNGMLPLANNLNGIRLSGMGNVVGCNEAPALCTPAEGNLISGNLNSGILTDTAVTGSNIIQANFIGTDVSGLAAIPNIFDGIRISNGNNVVGNVNAGQDNLIAFNTRNGVTVTNGIGNLILSNSIFLNGLLGIDLGNNGPTPNDDLDPDLGPNNLQNYPILNALTSSISPSGINICGTLNSKANHSYFIQLFSNQVGDPSGFGEGQQWSGELTVLTDGAGNADFCFAANFPAVPIPIGPIFTATATDLLEDGTSEFSPWIQVVELACTTAADCPSDDLCIIASCQDFMCVYTPVSCTSPDLCSTGTCNSLNGECVFTPVNCTSPDPCFTGTCNTLDGQCVYTPVDCTSPDPCFTGTCNTLDGQCVYTPVNCDSPNPCLIGTCNSLDGQCVLTPVNCTSPDPCLTGTCNPIDGQCVFTPISCTNPDLCLTGTCNALDGQCVYTPVNCTSPDLCIIGECNSLDGQCVFTPVNCTSPDLCSTGTCNSVDGQCVFTPVSCTSPDPCFTGTCNSLDGQCVFTPLNCDSPDPCFTGTCNALDGQCVFTPKNCDSGDLCLIDTCNPITGDCIHTLKKCPRGEFCDSDNGKCVSQSRDPDSPNDSGLRKSPKGRLTGGFIPWGAPLLPTPPLTPLTPPELLPATTITEPIQPAPVSPPKDSQEGKIQGALDLDESSGCSTTFAPPFWYSVFILWTLLKLRRFLIS